MPTSSQTIIDASGVRFRWSAATPVVVDLEDFRIQSGERVFVEGASGSGKSTLLSLLAGIVVPEEGTVTLLGHSLSAMSGAKRDHFRADHMGYIFQMFNLIPYLSVVGNVTLPCRFSKRRLDQVRDRAKDAETEAIRLLEHLGMGSPALLERPVTELSVGQQQRVAAARALIGAPEIVIADEPTSSLDAAHRGAFIELLFKECAERNATLIFVSHDGSLAANFDRTIRMGAETISRAVIGSGREGAS
jgi:putative ABC transport system ATP-binding protein